MRSIPFFSLLAALAGCAAPGALRCDFPLTRPLLVAELFFGRGNAESLRVSDADWLAFAGQVLTEQFPDGFTVVDAAGQWREAPGRPITRESSKLVVIAVPDSVAARAKLETVMAGYRQRFDQRSVGILLDRKCAAF